MCCLRITKTMGDTVDFSGWMFTQKMCGFRGFLDSVRDSAKTPWFLPANGRSSLVGGFKHELYVPFHIWDVIPTPLTKSMIFQDGYCTTNQI